MSFATSTNGRPGADAFTGSHVLLLGRLRMRPEKGPVGPLGARNLADLERWGLARIVSMGEPYHDPEASAEEGETMLYDVVAGITPQGRRYYDEHGLGMFEFERSQRIVEAIRKRRRLKPWGNPRAGQRVASAMRRLLR